MHYHQVPVLHPSNYVSHSYLQTISILTVLAVVLKVLLVVVVVVVVVVVLVMWILLLLPKVTTAESEIRS